MRYEGIHASLAIERPADDVVLRFADLGEAMRIYTDPNAFDTALNGDVPHLAK